MAKTTMIRLASNYFFDLSSLRPPPHVIGTLPVAALLCATPLFFFLLIRLLNQRAAPKGPNRRCQLPPGPAPWPVVGSLVTMLRHRPHFRWVLGLADGKDITCIRLGTVHVVVINSPELGREFLKKHDATFASRPLTMATEYSGRGFLSVVVAPWGDQWKKMRRVVASEVMSSSRLRWQSTLRAEEADHFTRYVYNRCMSGEAIDVRLALRYYCGNVIRRMIFGVRHFGKGGEHGGPGEEEVENVDAAFEVLSMIYAFCPSDFIPSLRFLDLEGHEKRMKQATRAIYKYHDPIIDERLEKWRSWREESGDDGVKKDVVDILDVLISLRDTDGKPLLTSEEIRAQSAELVYATIDNPSNIGEWALAEMLNQPDTLEKAVDELNGVVGRDRLVQEDDFSQLPYLKACAREALRLHPVAPFNLPHVCMTDATVAGYFIPKGSFVLLSRVGLGRNPNTWDDPLRFNPDRHLKDTFKEVGLGESDLRFISFSTGRRQCLGAPLGMMMTYMSLARMLQAFDWSLLPEEAGVDLAEEERSLFKAKPLRVCAKPRLPFLANL